VAVRIGNPVSDQEAAGTRGVHDIESRTLMREVTAPSCGSVAVAPGSAYGAPWGWTVTLAPTS
jgi:hypothetical protein